MKQSQLFTKTRKEAPKDEVSVNAQLLIRAGFVDKLMAGVYTLLPLGLRVMNNIEQIIREELNSVGGQEMVMPSIHPKENWEKTGRWEALDEDMYKIQDESKREYVLAPTHEEVIVPLVKKFVSSYRDLPMAVYQFQNKFRKEKRAKSGVLRGREFIMKDLYSFHLNEQDLDAYYERVAEAYSRIFERAGIGSQTFKTFASGGTFSKYSHEYQTITPAGEDIIYICNKCGLAINKEIKDDVPACPDCGNADFREEKAVEVGNIFKNKTKYTEPFELKVKDERGEDQIVLTGCYGIGLQRLMGTIVEVNHDSRGIVWPETVAPFRVHLISLNQNEEAEKIYQYLLKNNVEVLFDDRDLGAGEKFADSDLMGLPVRIVVSKKTVEAGKIEMKKRSQENSELITLENFLENLTF